MPGTRPFAALEISLYMRYNIYNDFSVEQEQPVESSAGFPFCIMKEWAEWFYNSEGWKECRDGFIASRNYLCERCSTPDNPVPAKIAHHKIYLTRNNIRDPAISLSWDNLEALCQDCHNKEHHRRGADRYMFDAEGNLLPIPPVRTNFFDRQNTEAGG